MKFTKTIILILGLGLCLNAQVPDPAPPQSKPVALVGGTAHIGNGQVIENAVVTFDKGKITAVADISAVRVNRSTHDVIDTTGKHVYPGFILATSQLGLSEVSSVRATVDTAETGSINPNVRSIIAYNTDSEFIPTLRVNGILMAETKPSNGMISGSSSVVQLDAWNWEDAAWKTDIGIHLQWPQRMSRGFDFATFTRTMNPNKNHGKMVAQLETMFNDARSYGKLASKPATNLKLEAMQGLFSGEKILFLHADQARDITEGVQFAKKHGIPRMVVVGATDALAVKDFLVKHEVPVILGGLHRLPNHTDSDIDSPYRLPAQLHEAGVKFCITYPSLMNTRNLPFLAGTAAAYGLDKEQALASITSNVASILGLEGVGSLENGNEATLFVSTGDALDMVGNNVEHAFINGRKIELSGMQQRLYERYKKKYNQ